MKKRWYTFRDFWMGFGLMLVINCILILIPVFGMFVWVLQWIYISIASIILDARGQKRIRNGLLLAGAVTMLLNTVYCGRVRLF